MNQHKDISVKMCHPFTGNILSKIQLSISIYSLSHLPTKQTTYLRSTVSTLSVLSSVGVGGNLSRGVKLGLGLTEGFLLER